MGAPSQEALGNGHRPTITAPSPERRPPRHPRGVGGRFQAVPGLAGVLAWSGEGCGCCEPRSPWWPLRRAAPTRAAAEEGCLTGAVSPVGSYVALVVSATSPEDRAIAALGGSSNHQNLQTERRLFNQAFFERLEVDSEEVAGQQLAEPFAQLLAMT